MIRFASASSSGDLDMADPKNAWPKPAYDAGPAQHLHALGVVSIVYNTFEFALFDVFAHHLRIREIANPTIEHLYWGVADNQRTAAIEKIFATHEKDEFVIKTVSKLIDLFSWCYETRNKILHSRFTPPFFAKAESDLLYLSKRAKKSSSINYLTLTVESLQTAADQIQAGSESCYALVNYLIIRDVPSDQRPMSLHRFYAEPPTLPEIPQRPPDLTMRAEGHDPPMPAYLRRSYFS
jgi:hypothetical protein